MGKIYLNEIIKSGSNVKYDFSVSDDIKHLFTDEGFSIEYPESIESVPNAVLAVPFVASAVLIAWMTGSELFVKELDKDFCECLPNVKAGLAEMYPAANFGGKLVVENSVSCRPTLQSNSGVFFSGGLDATTTLLRHLSEKPYLISLWGADVDYYNDEGWQTVETGLQEVAAAYDLKLLCVHTKFRIFDNAEALSKEFKPQLKSTWWYAVKHGIGIISHAAPLVWLHGFKNLYMASSNCPEDGGAPCASEPRVDNRIKFCGSDVFHDAFELNRQKKAAYICRFHHENPEIPIKLRVCWKSDDGSNCCSCEKCYRTMANLWAEGDDPKDFGFDYSEDALERMYQFMALRCTDLARNSWSYMKERLIENWDALQDKPYRDDLEWIKTFNFRDLGSNECRRKYQSTWKYKAILVKIFPHLYKLYVKKRGYKYE